MKKGDCSMLHSLRNKNKHRGPSSSKEFNEQNERIRKDIQTLYDTLNKNEKKIHESSNIFLNENFFLQRRVEALESEVNKLYREVEDTEKQSVLYSNFYNSPNIQTDIDKPVYINQEYGVATPTPTNVTNKLSHQTSSGQVVVPRDLEIIIEEEHAQEFRSTELQNRMQELGLQVDDIFSQTNKVPNENFNRIVDKRRDTFWTRQVVGNNHLELFGRMVIRTPKEGVTNLFSNTLRISTYPEGSMTIHSIMVKGLGNQWDLLENFPTENGKPKAIKNTGKLVFYFPRKEITEVIINFSQPYYLENNDEKIFTYGFQNVDLEYQLFTEKETSFVSVIDISNKNQNITKVDMPTVRTALGSSQDVEDLIEHELYYDDSLMTEFSFNSSILVPIDKVYIKTTLKRDGDRVPVLREIQTTYETEEK